MRRAVAVGAMLVLSACGTSSALHVRAADQRLAARIAPTTTDLGSRWKQPSSLAARARSVRCPPGVTGCAYRFFTLPGDPPQIPSASVIVQVFPDAAAAASAYATGARNLMNTLDIDKSGVTQTISLLSSTKISARRAEAKLLVYRVTLTSPIRRTGTFRSLFMREGRARLLLSLKIGRTIPFRTTAAELAARMRFARQ